MDKPINIDSFIRQMNLIYLALAIGQLVYLFIATQIGGASPQLHQVFQYLVPFVAIAAVLAGSFAYIQRMSQIKANESIGNKLATYQTAYLLRWALLEGAGIFSVTAYFLTGNIWYAYLFAVTFLPFLINRPSVDKCLRQIPFTEQEKNNLQQQTYTN